MVGAAMSTSASNSFITGIFKVWPTFKTLELRLFNLLIESTVVLYLDAIEYKLSPFWTT